MGHEKDPFEAAAFLDLLSEVMTQDSEYPNPRLRRYVVGGVHPVRQPSKEGRMTHTTAHSARLRPAIPTEMPDATDQAQGGDMLPDSGPIKPNESEIPLTPRATNPLCIISRDPLRAFIAAFNPALKDCEELTIIVDRRWVGSENVAARPAIERRQHLSVDAKVKTDGFAIVPLVTTGHPKNPSWIERVVDHPSAGDGADERELQRLLEFKRGRKARIGPLVRVSAIVGAFSVLVVLFVQMPAARAPVNRARPVALPTSEPSPEPPIGLHSLSVVEAPSPPRPSRLPTERFARPRDTGRARTEMVSLPPNPQSNVSLQSKGQPTDSEPTPPARSASVNEPADTARTLRSEVTRPAPSRSLIVASPEPTSPSASTSDPTRSSEGSPRRTAHTAPTPSEATASPSGAARQPIARGLKTWMQALESRMTHDVDTAGAEAKRQIDELKATTMRSLDQMRRVGNTATRAFLDEDANQMQREAAATLRR